MNDYERARAEERARIREKLTEMRKNETGEITVTMHDGSEHKIRADTDRALLYNAALSDALTVVDEEGEPREIS